MPPVARMPTLALMGSVTKIDQSYLMEIERLIETL
jgi:hypothetical protein